MGLYFKIFTVVIISLRVVSYWVCPSLSLLYWVSKLKPLCWLLIFIMLSQGSFLWATAILTFSTFVIAKSKISKFWNSSNETKIFAVNFQNHQKRKWKLTKYDDIGQNQRFKLWNFFNVVKFHLVLLNNIKNHIVLVKTKRLS